MMKSKFMAGLVATLISLVFVVIGAIVVSEFFQGRTADNAIKGVAFSTIAVWLGLYAWLKPKDPKDNDQNQSNRPPARENKVNMRV